MRRRKDDSGRITADVFGTRVGERDGFKDKAEGEISYVPVTDANEVLGYLWWSDDEYAAGFEPRPAAGPTAFDAASLWTNWLFKDEYKGLSPSRAVAELIAHHGGTVVGRASQESPERAANLAVLEEITER